MLHDLGNVGDVARAHFTKNTLVDPNDSTHKPVPPEDTYGIERAEGWPVWFDHTEHAVELPENEEGDEKVVAIPELFESAVLCTTTLLNRIVDHNGKENQHEPTSDKWANDEIGSNEEDDALSGSGSTLVGHSETVKIDNVGEGVDDTTGEDGPCGRFMKGKIFVERNDSAQGCPAHDGDEVAADWEQNEDDVDMEDQGRGTRNCKCNAEGGSGIVQIILEVVVYKSEDCDKEVQEQEGRKEDVSLALIDHPQGDAVSEGLGSCGLLSGGVAALEALESASLGLVSLKASPGDVLHVWMLVQSRTTV